MGPCDGDVHAVAADARLLSGDRAGAPSDGSLHGWFLGGVRGWTAEPRADSVPDLRIAGTPVLSENRERSAAAHQRGHSVPAVRDLELIADLNQAVVKMRQVLVAFTY